ncbi:MAG: GNAT family N-acetyltransferase [Alphaproteobacteria bacterium]|nr:GNAT family N-acetyltransferase [Alphaproteobacteria bacterium]
MRGPRVANLTAITLGQAAPPQAATAAVERVPASPYQGKSLKRRPASAAAPASAAPVRRTVASRPPETPPGALSTARLTLCRPLIDDIDEYAMLMVDRDVHAELPVADGGPEPSSLRPFTRPEAFAHAAQAHGRALLHWEQLGFGPWILRMKRRDGRLGGMVGVCGLRLRAEEVAPMPDLKPDASGTVPAEFELIYLLGKAYWGFGLATEAATAALGHGFAALKAPAVSAFVVPGNAGSVAVLRKLGFAAAGRRPGYGTTLDAYRLAAPAHLDDPTRLDAAARAALAPTVATMTTGA